MDGLAPGAPAGPATGTEQSEVDQTQQEVVEKALTYGRTYVYMNID